MMIATPEPTNQSVSVVSWIGKVKVICTTPKRMITADMIRTSLRTTGFIELDRWTLHGAVAAIYAAITLLGL